ncbi:TPA: undecaprenyldiphospho-muramoylpentapeptide beta-N-acetylglucosaminyltransferase [Candidatus Peregrinibacteria bacterium]|nr:undecaprenyldiphospho-muramoylpentapeptide beta-N-acetylglucosaminyltransferase [Candidatus Peregrinibacteria bacterium]
MRIVLTGGGTAGHILPNIAITEEVKKICTECEILYIGSKKGPEKDICKKAGISFDGVHTGKLRRYFSINNFIDLFKIPMGLIQSYFILRRFKPDVIFSKGGYVSVPVVVAGRILKIRIVIHEADSVPGLATKICAKFADKICVTFPETCGLNPKKTITTGMPVRKMIFKGSVVEGHEITKIKNNRPTIMIWGGSLGASSINEAVWEILPRLLKNYNVIHITGRGKIGIKHVEKHLENYYQVEYADKELPHLYAITDLVVGRAGASAVCEIAALNKPSLLIPLGTKISRGEQVTNADFMKTIGASEVIYPDENLAKSMTEKIPALIRDKRRLQSMSTATRLFGEFCRDSSKKIAALLVQKP